MKTIHQKLKDAGVEMSAWQSDLWVKATPEANKILADYEFYQNITRFRSQIDGCIWLDVPFANDDFWDNLKKQDN